MKHELKVPKAGQLDALRGSAIRQLSSNQLTGLRIRSNGPGLNNSNEAISGKNSQNTTKTQRNLAQFKGDSGTAGTTFDAGKDNSNKDLANLFEKTQNKSQSFEPDMLDPVTVGKKDRQAQLDVNSSDVEEVGTQMMVSRSNLVMDSYSKSKITSPKGSRARASYFKAAEAEAAMTKEEDSPGT